MTPAALLRRAADAFRTGEIGWCRDSYIERGTCSRCALAAITFAADQADVQGSPFYIHNPDAEEAARILAVHLIDSWDAAECVLPDGQLDVVETVGGWNDAPDRTVDQVVAALKGAAERAERHTTTGGKQ